MDELFGATASTFMQALLLSDEKIKDLRAKFCCQEPAHKFCRQQLQHVLAFINEEGPVSHARLIVLYEYMRLNVMRPCYLKYLYEHIMKGK
jgi:hypothetical protein